jgi:predicted CoA-binding protein
MANIDDLVRDFLARESVAVVGVSDRRETGCNAAYQRFKEAGYSVWPVNPRLPEFDGSPCYPNLRSIPQKPDAVFILANPGITDAIVDECVELGIKHVWMHCMLGTKPGLVSGITSVSQEAVEKCREHGIRVIPGSCPNQFLNPDFAHRMILGVSRLFGFVREV